MDKDQRLAAPASEPTLDDLRALNERLLISGLREQDLADQHRRGEEALAYRVEEEQRIRARVEQLAAEREAVLSQISDGIIISDGEGRITFINEAARRIHGRAELGVPVEGYPSTYHLLTLAGAPYPAEELPLARAVQRGETVRGARWRIQRPDGTQVVAEGSAAPMFMASGERLGAVLSLRDVTAEVELEHQKEAFLTSVAHDLGNPLTAIRGYSQLLRRRMAGPEPASGDAMAQQLEQIDSAALRMSAMLDDLLEIGRLQLGQGLDLRRQSTDLATVKHTKTEPATGAVGPAAPVHRPRDPCQPSGGRSPAAHRRAPAAPGGR